MASSNPPRSLVHWDSELSFRFAKRRDRTDDQEVTKEICGPIESRPNRYWAFLYVYFGRSPQPNNIQTKQNHLVHMLRKDKDPSFRWDPPSATDFEVCFSLTGGK